MRNRSGRSWAQSSAGCGPGHEGGARPVGENRRDESPAPGRAARPPHHLRRGRHRRRRDRPGRRPGCGRARVYGGIGGGARFRQGHIFARHQAGPWRRALPRARQCRAGSGGLARAHHAAAQRAASGPAAAVRAAVLPLLGNAFLRRRPEDVRRAGGQSRTGRHRIPEPRADTGLPAHGPDRGPEGRGEVLGRPVRRCPAGPGTGPHGRFAWGRGGQLLRRHSAAP